jgi:hypothetical protein
MTPEYTITFYAPDETMGDTPPLACEQFRGWALRQLHAAFPGYHVRVLAEPGLRQALTNDAQREGEIADFCARLWDRCPWDWTHV